MKRSPHVRVTLSTDLLNHLRKAAQAQHVTLRWLVAGLVCDTLEAKVEHQEEVQAQIKPWQRKHAEEPALGRSLLCSV